ncbi:hypothetical protein CP985_13825, partial [Malaciobacter mytili LMG 24559]
TNSLIDDVTNAAKEQTIGMTQIADAVNQLDKFTQENATIADKTNEISRETYFIAKELVEEANKSDFIGKDDIVVEEKKSSSKSFQVNYEVNKKVKKLEEKKEIKPKVISSKQNDDEWESF